MFPPSSVNDVCLLDYDGSTIASGHMDCGLRFWDSRSGNCVQEVTGIHQEQITSVSPTSGELSLSEGAITLVFFFFFFFSLYNRWLPSIDKLSRQHTPDPGCPHVQDPGGSAG
jgi:WD40 repeat protein